MRTSWFVQATTSETHIRSLVSIQTASPGCNSLFHADLSPPHSSLSSWSFIQQILQSEKRLKNTNLITSFSWYRGKHRPLKLRDYFRTRQSGPALGPTAWGVEGLPSAGTLVQDATWGTAQARSDLQWLPAALRTNTKLLWGGPEVLHNMLWCLTLLWLCGQ